MIKLAITLVVVVLGVVGVLAWVFGFSSGEPSRIYCAFMFAIYGVVVTAFGIGVVAVGSVVGTAVEEYYQEKELCQTDEDCGEATKEGTEDKTEEASEYGENYKYNVTYEESKELIEDSKDVIVYYWSPLCSYCVEETPIIVEALEDSNVDVEFLQVNVDEYEEVREDELVQLQGTPQISKYKDGEKVAELVGGISQVDDSYKEIYKDFFEGKLDGEGIEEDGNNNNE